MKKEQSKPDVTIQNDNYPMQDDAYIYANPDCSGDMAGIFVGGFLAVMIIFCIL